MKRNKRCLLSDAIQIVSLGIRPCINEEFNKTFIPFKNTYSSNVLIKSLSSYIRSCILFPIRLTMIFFILFPLGVFTLYFNSLLICFNNWVNFILGVRIRHKGFKRVFNGPHVYVANHTTFLDYFILSSYKYTHVTLGQKTGGIFNIFAQLLNRANKSIFFDRNDINERKESINCLSERLKNQNTSLLIFPEGKCNNNKHSSLFYQGAFSLGVPVIPVVIKYDHKLVSPVWPGDLFPEIIYLLTRFRVNVTVNWLEPTEIRENETPTEFAHRVKNLISKVGNLKNTLWSGTLHLNDQKAIDYLRKAFVSFYYKITRTCYKEPKDVYNKYYKLTSSGKKERMYFNYFSYEEFFNQVNKEVYRMKK
ncbi:GPAT4 [Hepatospora eriocheir]|uniref:GPAT4 n=1 Tax=Hepatospora eriocheir TaxID=1081669 RepID=A0A1X0QCJ1_9MICR|nr:GPAT4 [Hepatospora eriocheir]